MKVTIKEWNAVATWRWDIPEDDVCGICQVHFDGTCPSCKYPGDDCTLRMTLPSRTLDYNADRTTVSGKCGHNFHMVCFYSIKKKEKLPSLHILTTPLSTASWSGLNRTLHEDSVPCVDNVRILCQRSQSVANYSNAAFEWIEKENELPARTD